MNNTHTYIVKESDPTALSARSALSERGIVIAFPTDTVYGIGCLVMDAAAIERIYAIKERDKLKAIPVLIGNAANYQKSQPLSLT